MDTNINVANEIEALLSEVRQISERAIKAISDQESKSKEDVRSILAEYERDFAAKQKILDVRRAEIAEHLSEIDIAREKLVGEISAAVSSGDAATASSLEAALDSLNAEEYAQKRKAELYTSVDINGDEAIFKRIVIAYRNYLAAKELTLTENRRIYDVLTTWEEHLKKLQRSVEEVSYRSTYPDDQVAKLLRRHEPIDITGNKAGDHDNALRRYLYSRINGTYDRGFDGTPAGDKLREMEGNPLYPEE